MEKNTPYTSEISKKQLLGWSLAIAALGAYVGMAAISDANALHERDRKHIESVNPTPEHYEDD